MDIRKLAVPIVIAGLGIVALVVMSRLDRPEPGAGREQAPPVRRFGRREGEPRPRSPWGRSRVAPTDS